jgi:hypothetical protein
VNNTSGKQHASPLEDIEELIVNMASMLSQMGEPFNKQTLIAFSTDLLANTYHAVNSKEYFKDMYNKVYAEMVTTGVAVELEHEVMLDKNGNQVDDESKMYGLPMKHKIVCPENIVFVDETGCNTNMKLDGKVGGETFIISSDKPSRGMNGSMGHMHFLFLGFVSRMGDPIMCAVILKSEKQACDIPISWITGIDVGCILTEHGETIQSFIEETKEGGARWTYVQI